MQQTDLSKLVVKNICGVHRSRFGPKERRDENMGFCQLVIRITGTTEFKTDDGVFLSDCNHVVFVPKGSSYTMTSSGLTDSVWVDFQLYSTDAPLVMSSYEILNVQELVTVFERMERKRMFRKPAFRNYSMAALYELFARVEAQSGASGAAPLKYKTIKPAIDYIEKHYDDPTLDNTALAQASGISEVYLRKVFNAVFGVTPARYITGIRMEKAKTLLIGGVIPISEVAEAVGYSNIYHFSKAFKREVGVTPTSYSKRENT